MHLISVVYEISYPSNRYGAAIAYTVSKLKRIAEAAYLKCEAWCVGLVTVVNKRQ